MYNTDEDDDLLVVNNYDSFDDKPDHCVTEFGGSSQTDTQLSTARLAIENATSTNEVVLTSSYFLEARPVFEEMMSTCKTKQQFKNVIRMMNTQNYKHIAENRKLPHNNSTPSTYMFGQNNTNKRKIPQKLFPMSVGKINRNNILSQTGHIILISHTFI